MEVFHHTLIPHDVILFNLVFPPKSTKVVLLFPFFSSVSSNYLSRSPRLLFSTLIHRKTYVIGIASYIALLEEITNVVPLQLVGQVGQNHSQSVEHQH